MSTNSFANLDKLATHLRQKLEDKKFLLLYAYNGTGKTRLSMAFKNAGKQAETRDTLYFNAFTEDLFTWDNDLTGDRQRVLKINSDSRFFSGIKQLPIEPPIRKFLSRYVNFDFTINYDKWTVSFSREATLKTPDGIKLETIDNIKVSRGEENIFIWCFFLAIIQLAIVDDQETYRWIKYIYIDDPISSLDDNNAIAVACHLAELLQNKNSRPVQTIISSHHALFFNVMHNELKAGRSKKTASYFLSYDKAADSYALRYTNATPFFHHVAMLVELHQAEQSGKLYTYHFNILRSLLEKSATFHGYSHFSACIQKEADDPDEVVYDRLINILSHGNYSLYEPVEMLGENKAYFKKILDDFMSRYPFNPELFPEPTKEPTQ